MQMKYGFLFLVVQQNDIKIDVTSEYNDYIIDVENVKGEMGYNSDYSIRNYFKIQ